MCFQKENNILSIPTDFHTISVISFQDDAEVISTISFYEKLRKDNIKNDLYKIVFGEFDVINTDNLKVVTKVIGWHCRVLKTDGSNECIPFCFTYTSFKTFYKESNTRSRREYN